MTTQFAYNGDGVRASKTIDGTTTDYVVDLAATLPVVISDTDAIYLYGLDIIAEQLAQSDRYYYLHDGLGSVRQLLDNTGQIAETYAYDPFGVPLSGGTLPNAYRFTGEAWDAEVALLYLRARYYQPETGRFVTKDPWRGDRWQPGTLHGFVYVTNNPVNLLDPTGRNGEDPLGFLWDVPPVAVWIRDEMVRISQSDAVARILRLNILSISLPVDQGRYAKLGAFATFGSYVRTWGPWDPKREIARRGNPRHSHQIGEYWYYYDIWGNIMFGYLGTAAGFSELELLTGAGLEQIGSNIVYCLASRVSEEYQCTLPYPKYGWCTALLFWSWDDPEDQVTARIGIRLWKDLATSVQPHHITTAVSDAGDAGQLTRYLEPWFGDEGPMTWRW